MQKKVSRAKRNCKWKYIRQNWQLYVIFTLPAFLLTIIFKYIPMGGILIAFEDYNPMQGILVVHGLDLNIFKDSFLRRIL